MMDMAPSRMKALLTVGDGTIKLTETDKPTPKAGHVLVKVIAVAQNPTDWKTVEAYKTTDSLIGCDFAGIIAEVGPCSPEDAVRTVGERVCGFVHGSIGRAGAFAEYVVAQAALLISIPEDWTFEQAAQIPVACYTTCQCLYQALKFPEPVLDGPPPDAEGDPVDLLIWGGSSSVGQYLIQFAKLAPPPGIRVISTCSAKNMPYVRDVLGASHVVDYKDTKAPKAIKELTCGKLRLAVDCIGEKQTPFLVGESIGAQGGVIAQLIPYKSRKKTVETRFVLAYTAFGEPFEFPWKYDADEAAARNARAYAKLISKVLASGKLRPMPIKLFPSGLASVAEGFAYMKAGKVSAEKLTYRIADTPDI